MKSQRIIPFLALTGLCACATYQVVSINKAIEILTSIKEYSKADVPMSMEIDKTTSIYYSDKNTIDVYDETFKVIYGKQQMHAVKRENSQVTLEIFGGTEKEINYVFLENDDGKKYWEVDSRFYGTVFLNYLGLMQNRFDDESNILNNLALLNEIKTDKPSKETFRLTSNGKGNLRMQIAKTTDKVATSYDLYRLISREDIFLAENHTNNENYELKDNEIKRTITTTMIYKKIKITLPKKDDYHTEGGLPDFSFIKTAL